MLYLMYHHEWFGPSDRYEVFWPQPERWSTESGDEGLKTRAESGDEGLKTRAHQTSGDN